ncbi:hypothetical protein BDD12DRAFT_869207 [Trichophaea hybrida]|nr:hypothetical protein BDD12DRAFT_869207 [Trichophaea hybrida]
MERYFPRTPGGLASPLSREETQIGLELEQQMRKLVAEQMAAAVSRGTSPRGAYENTPKDATTKIELWQTGGVIPSAPNAGSMVEQTVMIGGLHSNPCPRGAAHVRSSSRGGNRRRSVSLSDMPRPSTRSAKDGQTRSTKDGQKSKKPQEKNVLESVLGIYPAENKLPPGRSAADDFVASIAKRFQFGRKSSVAQEGAESPSSGVSISGSAGVATEVLVPEKRRPIRTEPLRSTSRPHERESRKNDLEGSQRRQSKPRSKSRKRGESAGLRPAPSYERVYANMPLPSVPPPNPVVKSSTVLPPLPPVPPPRAKPAPAPGMPLPSLPLPRAKPSPLVMPVPGEDYIEPPPPPEKSLPKSQLIPDKEHKDRIRKKRSGRTFSPQYEIDIANWAESVYVFPDTPSQQTLKINPDPAVEDFPRPPSSPFKPTMKPVNVVKTSTLQRQKAPSLQSLPKSALQQQKNPSLQSLTNSVAPRFHSRASSQYSKASSQYSKGSSQLTTKQSLRLSPACESTTSLDTFDYETIIGTINDNEFETYTTATPSIATMDDISFAKYDMKLDGSEGTGLYGFDGDFKGEIYDHYASRNSMPVEPESKLEPENDGIVSKSTESEVASGDTKVVDLDAEIAAYLAERRKIIEREAAEAVRKLEKQDYKGDHNESLKPPPVTYRMPEKSEKQDYNGKFQPPVATYRPSDELELCPPPAYATSF